MSVIKTSLSMPVRRPLVRASTEPKYDLAGLRAGTDDSIVETDVADKAKVKSRLSSAVSAFKKRHGDAGKLMSFAVREVTVTIEDGSEVTAIGVWRLADKQPAAPAADTADQAAA